MRIENNENKSSIEHYFPMVTKKTTYFIKVRITDGLKEFTETVSKTDILSKDIKLDDNAAIDVLESNESLDSLNTVAA